MKFNDIKDAISARLGIDNLNEMQTATAGVQTCGTLVLLAPTGSGKTLAFAIPMLKSLSAGGAKPQAVVLAPSRELAIQIADVVRPIAVGLKTTLLTGGRSVADEAASLSVTPDIIVATPGRLLDHANRGNIDLTPVKTLVVDEYDKALELGFEEEMRKLARKMPKISFVILTSATELASLPDYLPDRGNSVLMDFRDKNPKSPKLVISRVDSPSADKLETLGHLLDSLPVGERAIVFANHRESVERIYNWLRKRGYSVGMYHGGLEQNDRENALERLSNGSVSALVSTDLGSRGVDLAGGVDTVVHYHLPPSPEAWTHRNGRTARQDAPGEVYVIVNEGENIPECVTWDREGYGESQGGSRYAPNVTLYLNVGKKEKISRGDIVGFLTAHGAQASDIGRIALRDHGALVAVSANVAPRLIKELQGQKIKNKSVKVSILNS